MLYSRTHTATVGVEGLTSTSHVTWNPLQKLLYENVFFCTDLDPGEEDHDSQRGVEDDFPVAEALKVAVLIGVRQQFLKDGVDLYCAIYVEPDTANRHDNHDDVQNVPERLEVRQLQFLDLSSHSGD